MFDAAAVKAGAVDLSETNKDGSAKIHVPEKLDNAAGDEIYFSGMPSQNMRVPKAQIFYKLQIMVPGADLARAQQAKNTMADLAKSTISFFEKQEEEKETLQFQEGSNYFNLEGRAGILDVVDFSDDFSEAGRSLAEKSEFENDSEDDDKEVDMKDADREEAMSDDDKKQQVTCLANGETKSGEKCTANLVSVAPAKPIAGSYENEMIVAVMRRVHGYFANQVIEEHLDDFSSCGLGFGFSSSTEGYQMHLSGFDEHQEKFQTFWFPGSNFDQKFFFKQKKKQKKKAPRKKSKI